VQGAAEDRLNSRPKPLAETFDRFVPCRSVRRTAEQTLVSAVGVNAIFRGELQFLAMASGEFALIRHADSRIHIRTEAAENALAEVEYDGPRRILVAALDSAGRTNGGRGTRILPIRPIHLRLATRPAGDFRRRFGIACRDDAGFQAVTKGFEHGQRSVPEYERLKLLFTTGKSGMMFPRIASLTAGHFCNDASFILQRASRLPGAV